MSNNRFYQDKRLFVWLIMVCSYINCAYSMHNNIIYNKATASTKQSISIAFHQLNLGNKRNIKLSRDIDLGGDTLVLPDSVVIKKGKGVFKNGTIIGKNTKIESNSQVFDHVSILGTWNVKNVSTELFVSLDYVNSLRDLFALCNPNIQNNVTIEEGLYWVSMVAGHESILDVASNTTIQLEGTINLVANARPLYYIFNIKNSDNIVLSGKGKICGDKFEHKGTSGEWGMGLMISNSKNIIISGMTIKNCWGDCIYVGSNSENVKIKNCVLDNGRRQGISVTSGSNISIEQCIISNVSGTAPEYAIDIEPNQNDTIDNIYIQGVVSENCIGGISLYGEAKNSKIGKVIIKDCKISDAKEKYPIRILTAQDVNIDRCDVNHKGQYGALLQNIESLSMTGNIFTTNGKKPINIINCGKRSLIGNIEKNHE